ncbi:MAG: N-acetylmuramoyl-L-alanine amidase [Bacteroidota bacterium]|nr:N-acetylmuramoyl-L-alanine amidase [Bacteroidota bacterium]
MITILYLIKVILVSGLLLGYYWLFLRNKTFHRYNRWFLLGIPVVSLVLPGLHLTLSDFWKESQAKNPIRLLGVANGSLEDAVTVYARHGFWKNFPWESAFLFIALIISFFFFIRLYRSLLHLRFLRRNSPFREMQGARIYFVNGEGTPFSFFKSIFWNKEQELDNPHGRQILRHEFYHVRHRHSLDILFLESVRTLFWFNPFIHMIRQEIQAVHEFAADEFAGSETDNLEYAEMLLINNFRSNNFSITHPIFQNQIKRRIAMITKNKKIKSGPLGRMMILPVVVLLLGLFAFKLQNHSLLSPAKTKTIRVVVDAAHGGAYTGAQANGILEKDINLQIAKKIQQLAKDYQVEVIMTRENDEVPGQFNNLRDDLLYRVALPAKENADLFISIHTNVNYKNSHNPNSGFEIYVPETTNTVYSRSVKLGSSISEFIRKDYSIAPELKQTATGALILNRATVPAVFIECGFIDNKTDLDFITNDKNQEKIARDILKGIAVFSLESPTYAGGSTAPVDTLTKEAMDNLDPGSIASMTVLKSFIYIKFKNGNESVVKITDDMRKSWKDSDSISQTDPAFTKVEVEAEYPGGIHAWSKYLQQSLKYPDAAAKNEIQGPVLLQFIVEKDGTVSNITVISGPGALRAESIRIIRGSGKWNPAKQNGHIVRSYHRQPIIYKLERQ